MEQAKTKTPEQRAGLEKFMRGALLAALLAIVLNNLYSIIFKAVAEKVVIQSVSALSITLVTGGAVLLGGFIYFILSRMTRYATTVFVIGGSLATLATISSSFMPATPPAKILHPGDYILYSIPMHLIAALCCLWIIPLVVRRRRKRWKSELHG
jgi:hypothetical protein